MERKCHVDAIREDATCIAWFDHLLAMTDSQNPCVLLSDLCFWHATLPALRKRTFDTPDAIFQRGMKGLVLGNVIATVNRFPNSNSNFNGGVSVGNVSS